MKRLLLSAAMFALLGSSFAPTPMSASETCRKGTIEFQGIKEALVGFAWEGAPKPLARGIMFETLLDRPSGDKELKAVVSAESCSSWEDAAEGGAKRLKLRFLDSNGLMLVLGDGNAVVSAVSCGTKGTTLVIRVADSFNIGMPPT